MHPKIRGRDIYGADLWEGYQITDREWLATGRAYLFTTHYNLENLLAFYLEHFPNTDVVEYGSDRDFKFVSVPSALPYKLANLVLERIGAV